MSIVGVTRRFDASMLSRVSCLFNTFVSDMPVLTVIEPCFYRYWPLFFFFVFRVCVACMIVCVCVRVQCCKLAPSVPFLMCLFHLVRVHPGLLLVNRVFTVICRYCKFGVCPLLATLGCFMQACRVAFLACLLHLFRTCPCLPLLNRVFTVIDRYFCFLLFVAIPVWSLFTVITVIASLTVILHTPI